MVPSLTLVNSLSTAYIGNTVAKDLDSNWKVTKIFINTVAMLVLFASKFSMDELALTCATAALSIFYLQLFTGFISGETGETISQFLDLAFRVVSTVYLVFNAPQILAAGTGYASLVFGLAALNLAHAYYQDGFNHFIPREG